MYFPDGFPFHISITSSSVEMDGLLIHLPTRSLCLPCDIAYECTSPLLQMFSGLLSHITRHTPGSLSLITWEQSHFHHPFSPSPEIYCPTVQYTILQIQQDGSWRILPFVSGSVVVNSPMCHCFSTPFVVCISRNRAECLHDMRLR